MQRFSYLFVFTIAFISMIQAELLKDYGVVGTTFDIIEEDLLEVIEKKLVKLNEGGSLQKHQQKIALEAQEKIKRPKPVEEVKHTTKPRSFIYDPSITVPYDLKDHQGRIFHAKGTKVNPLDYKSLSNPLLFIDGDDEAQVGWAKEQNPNSQIILIKGSPFELMEKLDRSVYFDQEGVLVKKLGIQQVPAKVTQQDKHLLFEEVVFDKTGEK
jgi:conjugal transfer pilus assembly protein TraW